MNVEELVKLIDNQNEPGLAEFLHQDPVKLLELYEHIINTQSLSLYAPTLYVIQHWTATLLNAFGAEIIVPILVHQYKNLPSGNILSDTTIAHALQLTNNVMLTRQIKLNYILSQLSVAPFDGLKMLRYEILRTSTPTEEQPWPKITERVWTDILTIYERDHLVLAKNIISLLRFEHIPKYLFEKIITKEYYHDGFTAKVLSVLCASISDMDLQYLYPKIIERCISITQDDSQPFASLEAFELMTTILEKKEFDFSQYFDRLLPNTVKSMVYSEEEIAYASENQEDAEYKAHGMGDWTTRKASAHFLDELSLQYENKLAVAIAPITSDYLNSMEWKEREVGVFLLGAVAKGFESNSTDYLNTFVPKIIDAMSDAHPLVQAMACWSISRYFSTICKQNAYNIELLVKKLILLMSDLSQHMRQSATASLCVLAEDYPSAVESQIFEIHETCRHLLPQYQGVTFAAFCDLVSTSIEKITNEVTKNHLAVLDLPVLMNVQNVRLDELTNVSIVETITSLLPYLSVQDLQPYAERLYKHGTKVIHDYVQGTGQDDFGTSALGLVGVLVERYPLPEDVFTEEHDIISLILDVIRNDRDQQAALATIGDFAIGPTSRNVLLPKLDQVVPLVLSMNGPRPIMQNMYYAVYEMLFTYGERMLPYVLTIGERLLNYVPMTNTFTTEVALHAISAEPFKRFPELRTRLGAMFRLNKGDDEKVNGKYLDRYTIALCKTLANLNSVDGLSENIYNQFVEYIMFNYSLDSITFKMKEEIGEGLHAFEKLKIARSDAQPTLIHAALLMRRVLQIHKNMLQDCQIKRFIDLDVVQ
jgi:hypothetical protein